MDINICPFLHYIVFCTLTCLTYVILQDYIWYAVHYDHIPSINCNNVEQGERKLFVCT